MESNFQTGEKITAQKLNDAIDNAGSHNEIPADGFQFQNTGKGPLLQNFESFTPDKMNLRNTLDLCWSPYVSDSEGTPKKYLWMYLGDCASRHTNVALRFLPSLSRYGQPVVGIAGVYSTLSGSTWINKTASVFAPYDKTKGAYDQKLYETGFNFRGSNGYGWWWTGIETSYLSGNTIFSSTDNDILMRLYDYRRTSGNGPLNVSYACVFNELGIGEATDQVFKNQLSSIVLQDAQALSSSYVWTGRRSRIVPCVAYENDAQNYDDETMQTISYQPAQALHTMHFDGKHEAWDIDYSTENPFSLYPAHYIQIMHPTCTLNGSENYEIKAKYSKNGYLSVLDYDGYGWLEIDNLLPANATAYNPNSRAAVLYMSYYGNQISNCTVTEPVLKAIPVVKAAQEVHNALISSVWMPAIQAEELNDVPQLSSQYEKVKPLQEIEIIAYCDFYENTHRTDHPYWYTRMPTFGSGGGSGGITPDSAWDVLKQESIELKTHTVSVEISGETKVESKEVLQLWNFDELSSKVDLSELSGESAETSSYQNVEILIRRHWPEGEDREGEKELEYMTLSSLVSELSGGGQTSSDLCVVGTDGSSGIARNSLTIASGLSTNLQCHIEDDGNGNLTATFNVFWR